MTLPKLPIDCDDPGAAVKRLQIALGSREDENGLAPMPHEYPPAQQIAELEEALVDCRHHLAQCQATPQFYHHMRATPAYWQRQIEHYLGRRDILRARVREEEERTP